MKKYLHELFIAFLLRREVGRDHSDRGWGIGPPVADANYDAWRRRHNRRIADDLGFILREGRIDL